MPPTAQNTTVRPASAGTLRTALKRESPGLSFEKELWETGTDVVVGVDEVGRGAWAGPLTVGAVVIPRDRRIYKIRDSKMLTEPEREMMYRRILDWAEAWSVGHATYTECDELGMSDAQRLAAKRALQGLSLPPQKVLVDGNWDFVGGATRIIRGDRISLSIAAASIVAKVTRDRIMRRLSVDHPYWNFADNKGYPCPHHRIALQAHGPSAIHRRSWVFMDSLIWTGLPRLHRTDPNQPELPFQPPPSSV